MAEPRYVGRLRTAVMAELASVLGGHCTVTVAPLVQPFGEPVRPGWWEIRVRAPAWGPDTARSRGYHPGWQIVWPVRASEARCAGGRRLLVLTVGQGVAMWLRWQRRRWVRMAGPEAVGELVTYG